MNTFRVKNYEAFQHYKDRAPPWIKLYNELLDDYEFGQLPDASKMHLVAIWLLASRSENKIPYDAAWVSKRINATEPVNLGLLVEMGFILLNQPLPSVEHVASKPLAKRLSRGEGEREDIEQTEKISEANASGADAPPDPAIPEREYFLRGREVLGNKSGAMIANLLKAKGKNVALARAALEEASQKQSPMEFVAAICRGPSMSAKPLTEFQRKQQETNDVRSHLRNYANGGGSSGNPDRVLSDDPGKRSQNLRYGSGADLLALPRASGSGGD